MTAAALDTVQIYTDGGCDPNPGPGGWGAVLVFGLKTLELSGAEANTTNNRMELTAAIRALQMLKRSCQVTLHTDSRYLQKGIVEWMPAWKQRGWLKANGKPVENQDLWQALDEQTSRFEIDWRWLKGHHGHPLNERADQLAAEARFRGDQQKVVTPAAGRQPVNHPDRVMPRYDVYTRACALGSPGPAGYAAVLVTAEEQVKVISGGWRLATSNVAELWAAVAALRALKEPSQVTIHTTSKYLFDNVTQNLAEWERAHWHTRQGQPVKNVEIWRELSLVLGDHDIVWKYIPGSEAIPYSTQASRAARLEAQEAANSDGLHG